MLSQAQSPAAAILASTIWGLGVCVMWAKMLASVAERYPRGGPGAMGLVGSACTLASLCVPRQLGAMIDRAYDEVLGRPTTSCPAAGSTKRALAAVAHARLFAP